jgi:hypothetical protein
MGFPTAQYTPTDAITQSKRLMLRGDPSFYNATASLTLVAKRAVVMSKPSAVSAMF